MPSLQQNAVLLSPPSGALLDYVDNMPGFVCAYPGDDLNGKIGRVVNAYIARGRNLVTTSTFSVDSAWTKSAGCTIAGGFGVFTAVVAGGGFGQVNVLIIGKFYEVTFDLVVTSGTMKASVGTGAGTTRSASGTYTEIIQCAGSLNLQFLAVTTFTGTIDNVKLKEVNIPASTPGLNQLMTDGTMQGADTSAWTSNQSATLTKQTNQTLPDGSTGNVLRVLRNGVTNPGAKQVVMTIGKIYRFQGWARSDGTAIPQVAQGGTAIWTGTTSTQYQFIDVVFIATSATIVVQSSASTGSPYVEFTECYLFEDLYVSPINGLQNGNFSADIQWTKGTGWTIPGGNIASHNTDAGTDDLGQTTFSVVLGKTYKIELDILTSNNTGGLQLLAGAQGSTAGNVSAVGHVSGLVVPSSGPSTGIVVRAFGGWSGTISNVKVTEVTPLTAVYLNGAAPGTIVPGKGVFSSFDGVIAVLNIASTSFDSSFPTDEGSLICLFKPNSPTIWTALAAPSPFNIQADSANRIRLIFSGSLANTFTAIHTVNGTAKTLVDTGPAGADFILYILTWSVTADTVNLYRNGRLVATATGIGGAWGSGSSNNHLDQTNCGIGAENTGGGNSLPGIEGLVALIGRAIVASECEEIARRAGVLS